MWDLRLQAFVPNEENGSWLVGDASSEFIPSGEQTSYAPKPSNEFRRPVVSMLRSACEYDGGFRVAQQICLALSSDGAMGGGAG
ncbi:hypothetical protein SNOG_06193 [Parastagonospora nodorum SN15]|uniref:Uncharacterized protein n=1 Tax=Phaeosphaeria nodorum (strain SN15 / ATCC MYA-4574 / FGSC 10173) TaxID=321614 RepID=Q0UPX1_PHANO|nr:hypothetical protein SNOG_06193 [Parastagonospora nodorum SN15]EAT86024.1 hypothetical protein SNOG_06193 [Parastagonospora nodorum SN15]